MDKEQRIEGILGSDEFVRCDGEKRYIAVSDIPEIARQINALFPQGDISIWCNEGKHEQCDGVINKDLPQPGVCICQCHVPQGDDEGLLTVEQLGFIWGNCAPETPISERCANIAKAQRDLNTRVIKQERLNRPELREKIADIIDKYAGYADQVNPDQWMDDQMDEVLALIPDEEEIRLNEYKKWIKGCLEADMMVSEPSQLKPIIEKIRESGGRK